MTLQALYEAIDRLNLMDIDDEDYNHEVRQLAKKYKYHSRWVAYVGACVAGSMYGKHLHIIKENEFDFCPWANHAVYIGK